MAGHTKVPDKKTVVAIIIIAILVIAAIVGTVAFLKNRGTTEATDLASYNEQTTETTQEEQTTTETQEQSGEQTTQTAEEQSAEGTEGTEETTTDIADNNERTTAGGNQGAGATGTTTGGTTTAGRTGTTTTTDNIQESTITEYETVTIPERLILEGEDKFWSPTELQASFASAYRSIDDMQTPSVSVEKSAETQTGENLVQVGETITYTIKVTNNKDQSIEKLYVTDSISDKTTYVEPTDPENAPEKLTDANGNVVLRWAISLGANEVKTLQFQVTVDEGATETIENVAFANGEESNKTETSIIKL